MAKPSFMNRRSGMQPRSLGTQLHDRGGERSDWQTPEGTYESFYPRDVPIWVHINTDILYEYAVYDRDTESIRNVATTWYEWVGHYVPKLKQTVPCSAGAEMNHACYGEGIRNRFFDRQRAIRERTGVTPKEEAPIGRGSNFTLSITVMEMIYKIPLMNKDGTPRKNRKGEQIYRYVPEPLLDDEQMEMYASEFGRNQHWTMTRTALQQLVAFEPRLKQHCSNCASEMSAATMVCQGCGEFLPLKRALTGEDLLKVCTKERKCSKCAEIGIQLPIYDCECGSPEEGSISAFDLRVKRVKTGDKSSTLVVTEVRLPGTDDPKLNARIEKLFSTPFNLKELFVAPPLNIQKLRYGDLAKDVDPSPRKKGAAGPSGSPAETESYADNIDFGGGDAAAEETEEQEE